MPIARPSRHLKPASPPATTRPGGARVHQPEAPSPESSHEKHGREEETEQLEHEHHLCPRRRVNQ